MRAVLDPNVLISAILSPAGAPARLLNAWLNGELELIVSGALLNELHRALGYPKLRKRISADDAHAFVNLLERSATVAADPGDAPPIRSSDPGDDYLIALARGEKAVLVSGDRHLLDLQGRLPIVSARGFLERVEAEGTATHSPTRRSPGP